MILLKKLINLVGDKRLQSIDLVETHAYGTSKNLFDKEEKIRCANRKIQCNNN